MPTVTNAARVTTRDGAVWRECAGCGRLAALAPEVSRCETCSPDARIPVVSVAGAVTFTAAELDEARAVLADVVRDADSRADRLRSVHAYLTGYLGATVTALVAGEPVDAVARQAAALFAVHREVTR